ncbi:MAG: hypothetical protein RSB57_01885 [Hungatella sp.]
MSEESRQSLLEQENAQLKADNEMLLSIMAQMKVTLNRLINRYMTN